MSSVVPKRRGLRQRELPSSTKPTSLALDAGNLALARRVALGELDVALTLDRPRGAVLVVTRSKQGGPLVRMVPLSRFLDGRPRRRSWPKVLAGFAVAILLAGAIGWSMNVRTPDTASDSPDGAQAVSQQKLVGLEREITNLQAERTRLQSDKTRLQGDMASREIELIAARKKVEASAQKLDELAKELRETSSNASNVRKSFLNLQPTKGLER